MMLCVGGGKYTFSFPPSGFSSANHYWVFFWLGEKEKREEGNGTTGTREPISFGQHNLYCSLSSVGERDERAREVRLEVTWYTDVQVPPFGWLSSLPRRNMPCISVVGEWKGGGGRFSEARTALMPFRFSTLPARVCTTHIQAERCETRACGIGVAGGGGGSATWKDRY